MQNGISFEEACRNGVVSLDKNQQANACSQVPDSPSYQKGNSWVSIGLGVGFVLVAAIVFSVVYFKIKRQV